MKRNGRAEWLAECWDELYCQGWSVGRPGAHYNLTVTGMSKSKNQMTNEDQNPNDKMRDGEGILAFELWI